MFPFPHPALSYNRAETGPLLKFFVVAWPLRITPWPENRHPEAGSLPPKAQGRTVLP